MGHRDGKNGTQTWSNGTRDMVNLYVNESAIGLYSTRSHAEHRPMGHPVQYGTSNREFWTLCH